MALTPKRKPNIHHRRTRGTHHKKDDHYLKAYHPYLPLLLLVVVGLAINIFWSAQTQVLGANTAALSTQELLSDTNDVRTTQSEHSLTLSSRLNEAAQAKANDMVGRDYWSHNSPDGQTPWNFLNNSGYTYRIAGENLAHGFIDSQSVVTGWMNSAEHRDNILNQDYQEVGFGIATSENFQGKGRSTVVVAMYGTPQSGTSFVGGEGGTAGIGNFASAQSYRTVSRIEMLSGGRAPWAFAALVIVTMVAAAVIALRHAKAWHKLLVKGEDFVLKHKTFDLVVLSVVLIGVIMTRTSGFIG